jgi:hypothetical protein
VLATGLCLACSPSAVSVDKKLLRAAPTYLLQEVASSPSQVASISTETMQGLLSTADVAMIGESHATGLERQVLAEVYARLFEHAGSPRRCLVETYGSLFSNADDPAKIVFDRYCPKERLFDNPAWDYTAELGRWLARPASGIVLTHTGFRHILPIARFYAPSFDPNASVDQSEHGTLTLQLPSSFDSQGMVARSFAPLAVDDLLARWIGRELTRGTDAAALDAQVDPLLDALALRLAGEGKFRAFELRRVAQAIPHHQAFIGVIEPEGLGREEIHALLRSGKLAEFFRKASGKLIRYSYLRGGKSTVVQVGSHAFNTFGVYYLSTPGSSPGATLYLVVDSSLQLALFEDPSASRDKTPDARGFLQ